MILIIYFTLAVLTNDAIGGLGGLYEKVAATASENYISGNYEGSVLTFKSKGAIIWGLILKFGNLALVVMVSKQTTLEYYIFEFQYSNISTRILHSGKNRLQPK